MFMAIHSLNTCYLATASVCWKHLALFPPSENLTTLIQKIIIQVDDTIVSKFILAGPKKMHEDFLLCDKKGGLK